MHVKKKKRRKAVRATSKSTPKDPLTLEHSKRHGRAVKRGIQKAKEVKHAVAKAVSVSKGKSKVDVVKEFLASTQREKDGCA